MTFRFMPEKFNPQPIGSIEYSSIWAFTDVAQVQSLVRQLRSHKLHGIAREKTKRTKLKMVGDAQGSLAKESEMAK